MPEDSKLPDRADPDARWFEHGAGASAADVAVEGSPELSDRLETVPFARPAPPLEHSEVPDQLAGKVEAAGDRQEALVDEAVEESFPASDTPHPKLIT